MLRVKFTWIEHGRTGSYFKQFASVLGALSYVAGQNNQHSTELYINYWSKL